MQISNNFNRYSAPKFGMALKLNKGAEEYLQKQSMGTLEKLNKAGEEMKKFKFWDLEVNSNGLRIKSKSAGNAYINPEVLTDRNPNTYKSFTDVTINTTYDGNNLYPKGSPYPIMFETGSNEKAVKLYNDFQSLDYVDKNIELTKLLEKQHAERAEDAAAKNQAKALKDSFISSMFDKFGNKQV